MKYIIPGLLIIFLSACSESLLDFESDEVHGQVTDTELRIYNKTQGPIWFVAIEQEMRATSEFVFLSNEENKIESGEGKSFSLDIVFGYERGDEIILYYWDTVDPESEDIKSIVIDTD